MATYLEKLRDPRWQRKRLEVMQRARFACERCDAADSTLNVHHKLYRKNANPWDYADEELECLCEQCHEERHHQRQRLDEAIVRLSEVGFDAELLAGFADGMWALCRPDMKDVVLSVTSCEYATGLAAAMREETTSNITENDVVTQAKDGKLTVRELWDISFPGRKPLRDRDA